MQKIGELRSMTYSCADDEKHRPSKATLLVALQKTPSLLGAECQGVGTTPPHANERGQTVGL